MTINESIFETQLFVDGIKIDIGNNEIVLKSEKQETHYYIVLTNKFNTNDVYKIYLIVEGVE